MSKGSLISSTNWRTLVTVSASSPGLDLNCSKATLILSIVCYSSGVEEKY